MSEPHLPAGKLIDRLMRPELLLIPLAFVFHFAWEMAQDPLYAGLSERPHGEVRDLCLMAALGDVPWSRERGSGS